MSKYLILLFLVSFSFIVFGQEDPNVRAKKIIEQKDLDGDGTLCLMECPTELSDDFKKIDSNKDNFLTEEEITVYLQSKEEPKPNK